MKMVHDAREIANWFIGRGKKDEQYFTATKLMTLTYIAHGWYLEIYDVPLISNAIVAWKFGPVISEVFSIFEDYRYSVTDVAEDYLGSFTEKEDVFLEHIYEIYGSMSELRLDALVRSPGGPWDVAVKADGYYTPILNESIRQHYINVRAEGDKQEEQERQAANG